MVRGQQQLDALLFGLGFRSAHEVQLVVLHKGGPDGFTARFQEGVGHAASHENRVDLVQQVVDHGQLVADLGATEDRHQGSRGVFEHALEGLDLRQEQVPRRARQDARQARHGSVIAVRGAERVVHKTVPEGCEGLDQFWISFRFTRVEANVLEQDDGALGRRLDRLAGNLAAALIGFQNVVPGQFRETQAHRIEAQFLHHLPIWSAEVREQDGLSSRLQHPFDGGQGPPDAGVIRDLLGAALGACHGNVEVNANQNALAFEVEGIDALDVEVHGGVQVGCGLWRGQKKRGAGKPYASQKLKSKRGD